MVEVVVTAERHRVVAVGIPCGAVVEVVAVQVVEHLGMHKAHFFQTLASTVFHHCQGVKQQQRQHNCSPLVPS